ncbi:hypothetical protein BU16DRAFT_481792 [Lophium mytilinum]|uniref:MYND-type domain-containing protein n=1 Tax=Lophium mytilinum TaxID=390894 RepID=A0A6A6R2C4_9PEZI|nr:hypothetical protein BU16DRAFT_481792 [Lophium mytilinum]
MSETFHWSLPGLDRAHFTALANLLSLRNGGQVEDAPLPADLLEEHDEDESDVASVRTAKADQIAYSGHDGLKRKFLDCLAEFAANKKGGRTVATTAMKESEDSVTLWISRNEGFPELDRSVYDNLSELLGRLANSKGKQDEIAKEELWNEMLAYHQDRIQSDYIPSLRADFKAVGNDVPIDYKLSALQQLVFGVVNPGQSTINHYSKLITAAYELRITKTAEETMHISPNATSRTKKLWVDICLLARLRVALQKFVETAHILPSFHNVTITLLARGSVSVKPSERPLGLKQIFDILRLDLDDSTVKSVMNQTCTLNRVRQEFSTRQKQKLNVHAEVQMLLFLCSSEPANRASLPYFGCSKYCCFMCARLLKFHGKFATRGCHGRLFRPWTVPEAAGLRLSQANRLVRSLIQLQEDVEKELKSNLKRIIRQKRTSAVGGSSVQAYQAGDTRKRSTTTRSSENPYADDHQELDDELGECQECPRLTSRTCSFCNRDLFCSEICEQKRSGPHLYTCTKRPLTTADSLYRSLGSDVLPTDADVLEDFGFNHLPSFADQSNLMGLYKGLYLSDKVTEEDLHNWRTEGTLVANIKAFFFRIPEAYRGGYFPWFLEHTHILEKPLSGKEATEKMVATFFDQANSYLTPEDQGKKPQELKPDAKAACYFMLAEVLHSAHPNPVEENWYTFGFCTCLDDYEERTLGGLYQKLLIGDKLFPGAGWNRVFKIPTFTEFWQAFEAGSLIELMDSCGLKEDQSSFRHLESFLSTPASHPSVWGLKQFLVINQPAEHPPSPALAVDYGFMNCRSFEETCTLMEIYKRLLQQADPLDLQKACLAGKLFEFAEKYSTMKPEWRRLMGNVYPLQDFNLSAGRGLDGPKTGGCWR